MRIRDIMTTDVETIAPGAPAQPALDRMRSDHIHHLIVAEGRSVLGVLSSRDLGEGKPVSSLRGKTAGELMSANPVLADPEMSVHRAANLLRGHSIGCLPVMESGRLVGIVTISDLLELIGRRATLNPTGHLDKEPHRRSSRRPNHAATV